MAVSMGWLELLILLFTGGSGSEILDFIESKSYWRAKNVEVTVEAMMDELKVKPVADVRPLIKALGDEDFTTRENAARKILAVGPAALPQLKVAVTDQDPEVASQARRLIEQLNVSGMARTVRRLMAIRTLGELKDAAALNVLKPLLNSEELFEADYAAQAIAAIEGKPFARKRPDAKLLLQDLHCLPGACGVLAKLEMQPGAPLDIGKILAGAEGLPPNFNKEQALAQTQQVLITFVERVGNIRLESVTLGVAEEVGPRSGYVALVARGLFNRDAVRMALKEMKLPVEMVGGMEVFSLDREGRLLIPSSDRVALLAGPSQQQLPLETFVKAIKEPGAASGVSKEMSALRDTVDKDAFLWAVARMSKSYREAPLFAPFDTITLQGKQDKDCSTISFRAIGKDAEKVTGAVEMFEEGLKQARTSFERDSLGKMFKPMSEFLRSLQAEQDGPEMRVTGKLTGSGAAAAMPFFFLFMARSESVQQAPVRAVAPVAK
jgi:hypothetical protein